MGRQIPDYLKKRSRSEASGRIVLTYGHKRAGRKLLLAPYWTRCVRKGEIHELILTTTESVDEVKQTVEDVAYIGFAEFNVGCVIVVGDEVLIDGKRIGHVLGFDETHMPNHLNIVIEGVRLLSGDELGAKKGATVRAYSPEHSRST